MKKVAFMLIVCMSISGIAFATLDNVSIQKRNADRVKDIYIRLLRTKSDITTIKNLVQDDVNAHPAQFDTDDKTNFSGLKTLLTAWDTATDNCLTDMETDYPTICG